MKQLLLIIICILSIDALLPSCANPSAPTGGEKDTIPPILTNAYPPFGNVFFEGNEITLEFDERVSSDKIKNNLIITPQLDIQYKTITKKNKLTLRFEENFPDSTTITLNFFDGITDITENNPAVNLSYVFSTSSFLDSLFLSGNVSNLMTNKPDDNFLVGIYPFSDSLDFFKNKPMYFTSTTKDGNFKISNIKNGSYKLLAFNDVNRNLTFEPTTETFGFKSGIMLLDSNIQELAIKSFDLNVSRLELITSRVLGNYFDLRYSKGLDSISINQSLNHNFLPETNSLRFYKPKSYILGDSIQTIVTVIDSVNNVSIDTVFVKFSESKRKPSPFTATIQPSTKLIEPNQNFSISFSKPILSFDTSIFHFTKDSTITIPVDSTYHLNSNSTTFTLNQFIDTSAYFFLQKELAEAAFQMHLDTLVIDSTLTDSSSKQPPLKPLFRPSKSISLTALKGTFISIENDTLPKITQEYSYKDLKETGEIILNITTDSPSYYVQLIDKKFEVYEQFSGQAIMSLKQLPPGDYGIRILIDANQDGKWSIGNLLEDTEPEPIYVYPEFTSLRANWDITLDISF